MHTCGYYFSQGSSLHLIRGEAGTKRKYDEETPSVWLVKDRTLGGQKRQNYDNRHKKTINIRVYGCIL